MEVGEPPSSGPQARFNLAPCAACPSANVHFKQALFQELSSSQTSRLGGNTRFVLLSFSRGLDSCYSQQPTCA